MSYSYQVKQIEVLNYRLGKVENRLKTFICIKDDETGIALPHPISNFLNSNSINETLSQNTLKRYAEDIKKFLNYLLLKCSINEPEFMELKNYGLQKLKIFHGISYLNFLYERIVNKEIKPKYYYDVERILTLFYSWLNKKKIVSLELEFFEIISESESPFRYFEYDLLLPHKENKKSPSKRVLHDFGSNRMDLIIKFIRVSEIIAPEISFGIILQFFGGLRRGEVVNLTLNSIKFDNVYLEVNIKDNFQMIFENKKSYLSEQVKTERTQVIFELPLVRNIYDKHLKRHKRIVEQSGNANKYALFLSTTNGAAISGAMYWYRFNKVKEKFLEVVAEDNIADYEFLISKNWSTHIGRGIYTNILTFMLNWNESEVAIARGDYSTESSKDYKEVKNVYEKIKECSKLVEEEASKYI
ncbi:hypothetical protein [Lysinibacillus sphaericus]|uniref:hypothetical protein n=1 Tax=Lysinibacillus sphaericus TaxID=1421 RepID=UPI001A9CF0C7|nr:hypothetical protein [Lysinibacillus sphaericus]QTB25662.1 hypothetical protein J2D51_15230 [Lysinibacillus sphaericus]